MVAYGDAMDLQDKIVVVTGGASGIGRALATRFVAEGADTVVIADLPDTDLSGAAAASGAVPAECDVSNASQVVALIDAVESEHGPIDLFCSNAGIGTAQGLDAPDEAWQQIWEINVMGHVYAARALVPRMIDRGGGYLLNTASAAGLLTNLGEAPYSVTKHAAVALAEWIAITHGDQGIKVSCLCPQGVRTPMTESDDPAVQAVLSQGAIEPEDVADAVVAGLADERFLILPHPEVEKYEQNRTADRDRWLGGMRKLQRMFFPTQ